jgi:Stress responsive A/B Barrel Domain
LPARWLRACHAIRRPRSLTFFRRMVHNITLFKLQPEVSPVKLEQLMMTTRMTLLKIPEILSVRCGKNIDPTSEWPFFIALEFESTEKLAMTEDDAIYMKFVVDVIKPNTIASLTLNYEMEPGKSIKYS